jgi:hypothetical protein
MSKKDICSYNYDELKEDYLKAIEELALCKDRLRNYESAKTNNVG